VQLAHDHGANHHHLHVQGRPEIAAGFERAAAGPHADTPSYRALSKSGRHVIDKCHRFRDTFLPRFDIGRGT
jgi:hypothetical protein